MTWRDINLEGQYLTVRRSMRYNGARHKTEIGATKRKKIRTVDFCDTLAEILRTAKAEQHKTASDTESCTASTITVRSKKKTVLITRFTVCREWKKSRRDTRKYPLSASDRTGRLNPPSTVGIMCRAARKKVDGLEDFHFHQLRHTFTSNLLSNGAAPKDVQELSDTLMSVPQ